MPELKCVHCLLEHHGAIPARANPAITVVDGSATCHLHLAYALARSPLAAELRAQMNGPHPR